VTMMMKTTKTKAELMLLPRERHQLLCLGPYQEIRGESDTNMNSFLMWGFALSHILYLLVCHAGLKMYTLLLELLDEGLILVSVITFCLSCLYTLWIFIVSL
jgi:hypothetical protein